MVAILTKGDELNVYLKTYKALTERLEKFWAGNSLVLLQQNITQSLKAQKMIPHPTPPHPHPHPPSYGVPIVGRFG